MPGEPIRFGLFEFDPRSGELRKQGLKIRLQGQPVEILSMLLARPGELVTREELQKKLWPEDTFVDFDPSLNAAMKRLRSALGDSAETPRFIETLARRGYRFLAPVDAQLALQPRCRFRLRFRLRAAHFSVIGCSCGSPWWPYLLSPWVSRCSRVRP